MKAAEPATAKTPKPLRYYAHTAEDAQGNRLPESSGQWQLLSNHLRNVADLAAKVQTCAEKS